MLSPSQDKELQFTGEEWEEMFYYETLSTESISAYPINIVVMASQRHTSCKTVLYHH